MAGHASTRAGRNDPCPCGSGRKYKQCCLRQQDAEQAVYASIRQAESRLVGMLFDFALNRWGERWFSEGAFTFYLGEHPPEALPDEPDFDLVFLPWLVFHFAPNPRESDAPAGRAGRSVAEYYLDHHASDLSPVEASLLRAAVARAYSFYQVVGTSPGRSIDLRDVFTGQTVSILDRAGSTSVEPGVLVYALVVTVDGVSLQVGMAPEQIPPDWHTSLLDFRNRFLKKRALTPDEVARHADDIRRFYLYMADRLRHPRPPTLLNTDGEAVVPTTLDFELRCPVEHAFDRLKTMAIGHDPDDLLGDAGRSEDGALRKIDLPWLKKGNRKHKDWENTILGNVTIEPGRLTVFVNSKSRADRCRRDVARRLGADVVFEGSRTEPIEKAWEAAGRAAEAQHADPPAPESPEIREALREMQERHWEAWLDERVPALGNKTPRQAATTALGREKLEALLGSFEWRNQQVPEHQRVDVPSLRRKLGLG